MPWNKSNNKSKKNKDKTFDYVFIYFTVVIPSNEMRMQVDGGVGG